MSIAHLLEDFGSAIEVPVALANAASGDAGESMRLEAYEDGYKAGWDDAVGANQAEQMQVAADLAQNLRDMSFTYQEACTHISQSLHGVFDAMMSLFLPEVARIALAPKVAEELGKLPLSSDDMQLVLSVSPESKPVLERLRSHMSDQELTFEEDPSLTAGQVLLGFGDKEVAVDFDALLEEMRGALETFSFELKSEAAHG